MTNHTDALTWNFGAGPVQTLSNGITVGYMERLHVRFGNGDDSITGGNGSDYLDGGAGNDTLHAAHGADTVLGGDGNDVLFVSYDSGTGDGTDLVYGGTGHDRAVYDLGGSATLYRVTFYDPDGTEISDFDAAFDLSQDLSNFSRVNLWGGSGTDFYEVEAIDVDATDAARSNSSGEFWYLGGALYLGASGRTSDRFIANWSNQTIALDWDMGAAPVQTLQNGVTVGGMERLHVLFGSGNDNITARGGADYLNGGAGNDTLRGGIGADTLVGGAGNDVLYARNDYESDRSDTLDGGDGDDTAWFTLDINGYYGPIVRMYFFDQSGNYYNEIEDVFANLTQVMASGYIENRYNDNTSFRNIEHINIDARLSAGQGNSSGNQIWYLGGTEYFGSLTSTQDQFYADWTGQSAAIEWNIGEEQVATLANGVTVGYLERAYLRLGTGDDRVVGAGGNDTFWGGAGHDILDGAGGNDQLLGGVGDDLLNGGSGSDTLDGGTGADILGGGDGSDTYLISAGDEADVLLDPDGGRVYFDGLAFADVTLARDGSALQIGFAGTTDSLRVLNFFAQVSDFTFYFDGAAQTLDTAALADPWDALGRVVTRVDDDSSTVWQLMDVGEFVYMKGGTDGVYAGAGADLIDGGAGEDVVSYEHSDAAVAIGLDGTPGVGGLADGDRLRNVEALRGSAYADTLTGVGTDDSLAGDAGDDLLIGNAGNDTLYGQMGNDTLIGAEGDDLLDGGDGIDLASYAGALAVSVDLSLTVAQDTRAGLDRLTGVENLLGGDGNDTLAGDAGDNLLTGGLGDDSLSGAAGNDTLTGGDGVDTLIGLAGDDTLVGGTSSADLRDVIYGGEGNDNIDGGYGNDELRGDAGNDTIVGGFGVDDIFGGMGDDQLTGQAWSDLIFGGDGNDFINGGFGYDRVNGGAGADRFFHLGVADHGSDWIQDYNAAEGDVLVFGGSATRDQFQVNLVETANAGAAGVEEAFVIYRPTGQILWALVDGGGQSSINLVLSGTEYDLLV